MKEYILSLDQGTTSSRAVLFNAKGEKVASVQKEYPQIFPGNGWVEHDPMDILESQLSSAREVIAKAGITAEDVAAIGIANQRETTILWDKNTGKPVYNAIVWQCRRTSEDCARMESQGLQKFFKDKTGLLIDPYFFILSSFEISLSNALEPPSLPDGDTSVDILFLIESFVQSL